MLCKCFVKRSTYSNRMLFDPCDNKHNYDDNTCTLHYNHITLICKSWLLDI